MQELEPGLVIASYRVIRQLGAGGMGAVYEVEHVTLGVHYALKTFTLEKGHAELFRKRFLAEGRLLARLSHPNLVRVFDLAYDEALDLLYYVMDLVLFEDGEAHTLMDIEQGSAEEGDLVQWFGELCQALAYVHAQGIVHRDIKLGNILLAPRRRVVLSDFGISKVLGDKLRTDIDVSRTMTEATTNGKLIMGTKGYMAPEVLRGEEATPAADVYALGVAFFYLLTGVWYDKVLVEKDRTDLHLLQYYEYRWRDVLPAMLDEDPAKRPLDLDGLVARLTQPDSAEPRRRPFARPWTWVAGVAAVLCVAVGTYFLLLSPRTKADAAVANSEQSLLPSEGWLKDAFEVPESMR